MKRRAETAPIPPRKPVTRPAAWREWQQRGREAWDALSLPGQLRFAILAAVTLAILVAQLLVASFDIAANYIGSRYRAAEVASAILQYKDARGNRDVLAGVHAQPSVIAATLEQPAGEVLWTFDRNAPDTGAVVAYGRAPPLNANRAAWYEHTRLDANLHQALTYVTRSAPLAADVPAELSLFVATPSSWHVAQRHLLQTPFILAIGWALALFVALRLSRQVAEPLEELVAATRLEGRYKQAQEHAGRQGNELTRLAQNFHALTDKLTENEREMRNVRLAARQQILERTHELQLQLQQAESMMRSKDQFLANMSHEIRTPMNGVLGMAELLAGTTLDKRQRRFVDSMREAAGTMMQIINDILDDSKIEAGKMELVCEPFEVRDLVEQAAQLYAGRAETKKLELICQVEPGVPAVVIGDALRLRQVLGNLLSNAQKFTPEGGLIRVEGQRREDQLELAVVDTGRGIPPEAVPRLFRKFSQVERGDTRRAGGAGLGLWIAQQLMARMGGAMAVESEPGRGSRFTQSVPMLPP
jgi:signal transduction histidine kinase